MSFRADSLLSRAAALALALVLSVPSSQGAGSAPAQQGTERSEWQVKYEAGARPILTGTRLRVTMEEGRMVCAGKAASFSIPLARIIDVSTNSRRRYPFWDAQMRAWEAWAGVTEGRGLAFFTYGVPLLLVSLASKSRDYLLDIRWEENGVQQNALLAIDKEHYSPFLAELNRATGKEWKNLEAEWQRIEQEIKREQGNKIPVRLDRRTLVGGLELKPGVYQIVFLPRQGSLGEVYFFRGHAAHTTGIVALTVATSGIPILAGRDAYDLSHKEMQTSAKAEVVAQPSDVPSAQVTYKEKNGATAIAEIRTAKKTFRFP